VLQQHFGLVDRLERDTEDRLAYRDWVADACTPAPGETVIAKMREGGLVGDFITTFAESEDPVGAAPPMPNGAAALDLIRNDALRLDTQSSDDPRYVISIAEEKGPGGKRAVPVSVNGRTILIPRGKPCDIAARYYEALKDATESHFEERQDPTDPLKTVMEESKVPSYPWSVISAPSRQELEAWAKRKAEKQAEQVAEKQKTAATRAA